VTRTWRPPSAPPASLPNSRTYGSFEPIQIVGLVAELPLGSESALAPLAENGSLPGTTAAPPDSDQPAEPLSKPAVSGEAVLQVSTVPVLVGRPLFSILGPLEVSVDGARLALSGQRQRRLLTALLLQPNRVVPVDQLVDSVWGTEAPPTVRTALQVHVSQLRKAIGADAIATHPGGYALQLEPEQIDVARFDRLLRAAREADQPERRSELLREALGLVRGPPLGDLADEAFARPEALRLDELCVSALEERIEADLARGPRTDLIAELESVVAAHPWRERPRALLMQALYLSGRQADALAVYREARRTLVENLGVEPSQELRDLERAILAQDPSLAAAAAEASGPVLPPPPRLLGRERELGEVATLVVGARSRIITLTGPGGIGKTGLAVELARRLVPAFNGSVAFASLEAIDDPLLVPPTIAQALGLKLTGDRPAREVIVERLRERPTLLVVDGFEQVASARLVLSELVAAAPDLVVVVTSRAVLRLSGEREYPVRPLDQSYAVRLFVEHARGLGYRFEPDGSDFVAVAEICERLDGLPLAIELAAARTQLLSPDALLARLGSLDVLGSGDRDAPARQQTLRATIDWSYALLTEEQQQLFTRLAVFVGGWTVTDAETICGGPRVLDGLTTLVDSSLVLRSEDRNPRLTMLNTVRDYALEQLAAAPDRDALRRRHAAAFLALAQEFEEQHNTAHQPIYERLELEHANVRAALAFFLEAGDGDDALRLAASLSRFWQIHGYLAEGQRLLEAALAAAGTAPHLRARAFNGLGIVVAQQGDLADAAEHFAESLELSRQLGNEDRAATAVCNLGNVRLYQGQLDEARAAYEEAASGWEAAGNRRGIVTATQNLASVDLAAGRSEDAFRRFDEASRLARLHGDPLQVSSVLRDLARGLIEAGRIADAREALAEAYPVMRTFGHLADVAGALELYAAIADAEDDPELAAGLLGVAARIRGSIGAVHRLDHAGVVERTAAAVRERLGEEAFAAAFDRGQQLPLERATDLPRG